MKYAEGSQLITDYSMAHRGRFSDPESVLYPFGYGIDLNKYSVSAPQTVSIGDEGAALLPHSPDTKFAAR